LGIVAMGPTGAFDAEWDGAVHAPLAQAALQLSRDLGWQE
jgi:DNA-binding IclR family transcriptional regulator